jgi:hypothetical protein
MTQAVEHLPCKHETLSSNPNLKGIPSLQKARLIRRVKINKKNKKI